jgi:tRNA pseudouridine38-40 synthase
VFPHDTVEAPAEPARTLKLTIQYDGSAYAGWQRQANGPSIQAAIEHALASIEGRDVRIVGAGRTDAGVHAFGQVASVRLRHPIGVSSLARALNALLPSDIRIVDACEEAAGFHARHGACAKTYRYRLICGSVASPFERRYAWHVARALDLERMEEAASALVGRHDFAAFQSSGSAARSTVRTVFDVGWQAVALGYPSRLSGSSALVAFDIRGDGFLRHMVRTIVGTLVEIGQRRRPVGSVEALLGSGVRSEAGPTAPPHGLFLVRVGYRSGVADRLLEPPAETPV